MTDQLPPIEAATRERVAEFLPQALSKTLESYREFISREVPDDAKNFSNHHAAAKVAISHIQLLIKLAAWAQLPEQGSATGTLNDLFAEAQAELAALGFADDCDE